MKSQKEVLAQLLPIMKKNGSCFQKFLKIKAKPADPGSWVITQTTDGIETKNQAKPGDWLVENQTEAKEQYLVSEKSFEEKYSFLEKRGEWGIYAPKGKILAVEFNEKLGAKNLPKQLVFEAPWGEKMRLRIGDYLVCPLDKSEIYRIAQKEFLETYQPC